MYNTTYRKIKNSHLYFWRVVQNIDDTTSYEEILCTLYLQFEVQKGIKDMEQGKGKTSAEVKEIINKC